MDDSANSVSCPRCGAPAIMGRGFCTSCGERLPGGAAPALADPLIGRVIADRYRIQERIGTGAMGCIYKAAHDELARAVAIKVLHRHLLGDESQVLRFHREARAASRLSHPNCIAVQDFGQTEDGLLYIVMEYLAGRDLCTLLFEERRLPWERAVHIAVQVLDALEEAHGNGIVHRDLKPENIMILKLRSDPEFVKVLDFGIAKLRDAESNGEGSFKTVTGMVFGTPEYMSPEQIQGLELDGRSDLYSLGVVMYQMLAGAPPFAGDSIVDVADQHMTAMPVPLCERHPGLPPALCDAVECLLAKKPEDRPSDATAARNLLLQVKGEATVGVDPGDARVASSVRHTTVWRWRRLGRWGLLFLVVLASAAATWLLMAWMDGQ